MNLVNAQQARRILDRIVGYKLSPLLWKKIARGLSAGRVQSVTVRLIAEREREIQNFTPQEYWTITAKLKKSKAGTAKTQQKEFEAILIKKEGKVIPKLGIEAKKEAEKIVKDLKGAEYKVIKIEKREVKRNPFPPFTTSTLQQESWQRFRFSAKLTMQVAQQLYEKGYITYHRTDSLNLSEISLFGAKKFIIKNYGKDYWAGFFKKYKAKGRVQEAHEAIRPTYPDRTSEKLKIQKKLDDRQYRLYDLIWRRFIACQMSQAVFDSTLVDISAKNPAPYRNEVSGAGYIFRATGQTLKFDGFLKIYPIQYKEMELSPLQVEEILKLIKLISSQHFTQPPPRYTEATLIKALEEKGIGRPSTYAPILSTIQERNYVRKDEKKRFYPTEIGSKVNDFLVDHFPEIVNVSFTAKMEEDLDKIAQAKRDWVEVLKSFYLPFKEELKRKNKEIPKEAFAQEKTSEICPKCSNPLVIRMSKYGRFYSCSTFPKCRYKKDIPQSLGINCPKCKTGEIIKKGTKNKFFFYGCSNYPECDFALWDRPTGQLCPGCKSFLVKNKWGKIKCSNKACDYVEYSRSNKEK
jgi:DNA topoisomerase-1